MKKFIFFLLLCMCLSVPALALPDDTYTVNPDAFPPDFGGGNMVSTMSVEPITPSDTSGLKALLLTILGDYDSIITEYSYQSGNGYTNYLREVSPDYVWLCSAAVFLAVLWCTFRMGGALLCRL